MFKKYFFLQFTFFIAGFMIAQKPMLYYSQFVSKNLKDHSTALPNFIKNVAQKNAQGIIDGYNIEVNREINIQNLNNIDLVFKNTKLFSNTRFKGALLNFSNINGLSVSGLNVSMSGQFPVYQEKEYPTIYNAGIIIKGSKNITIQNSKFEKLYTRSLNIVESSGNIIIRNNSFVSNKQNQKFLLEHVVIGSSPNAVIDINCNAFTNDEYNNPDFGISAVTGYGLGKNGGKITVRNNHINFAGRSNAGAHRLYAIDFYDDCDNVFIENNIIDNVMWGAVRFNGSAENILIKNNKITIKNPEETGSITSTTTKNNKTFKNIVISDNEITSLANLNSAIYLQNPYQTTSTEGIKISNNKINNSYVGILLNGFFQDVEVSDNIIKGNFASQGIVFTLKNNGVKNKTINIINNNVDTKNSAVSVSAVIDEKNYNPFNISENIISSTIANGDYGIIINTGMKGEINLNRNSVKNYKTGIYVREKNVKVLNTDFGENKIKILKD